MLKVLLAGLGVRGRHWARVITGDARADLLAYVDTDARACQRACAEFGDRPAFASVEAALNSLDEVDALVLANPPLDREGIVRAAAGRGLHLLIEKPLALDLDEARRLVEIAETGGVSLMVGLNFRYLDVTKALKGLLRDERVGKPAFARFTYERWRDGRRGDLNDYPLTMRHPMLWEQSIHHFDLMRYVYEQEPLRISCRAWNPDWSMYAHESNVSALIEFDGGMIVNYHGLWQGNWAVPGFEWRSECSEGIITQRGQFGQLYYASRDDEKLTPVSLPPHERWITETRALFERFVNHALDGAVLECGGRDHLMSLAMLEACIRSSEQKSAVDVRDVWPPMSNRVE
ncbi:MAG: Gfo/Idh/MocA family oxidoreductase [Chloroflexota bacterium]|nr:Gfo/Idh/MocA family oxidoreductase [Chloroflexota bacterium]